MSRRAAARTKAFSTASSGHAALVQLGRQYPDEPSLIALKDSLRSERRREEAEQALTLLAEALNRRDWPAAEKRFVAAAAVAPDSPRIPEARTRIERGKRRDKALADARIAHKKSCFDEVERLLNPVVSEDTADAEAMELLRDAQSRRSASEAEAAIAQGRKQAKALAKERRFEDAQALCATRQNARANGAAYLAGFVIEILLKARLVRQYETIARKRQHDVKDAERGVWSLIWRSHDLGAMLDAMPELTRATSFALLPACPNAAATIANVSHIAQIALVFFIIPPIQLPIDDFQLPIERLFRPNRRSAINNR